MKILLFSSLFFTLHSFANCPQLAGDYSGLLYGNENFQVVQSTNQNGHEVYFVMNTNTYIADGLPHPVPGSSPNDPDVIVSTCEASPNDGNILRSQYFRNGAALYTMIFMKIDNGISLKFLDSHDRLGLQVYFYTN